MCVCGSGSDYDYFSVCVPVLCRVLTGASPSRTQCMERLAVAVNRRMSLDTPRVSVQASLMKER